MAILGDGRDTALTTIVGFHDLLGFASLLASSGGTLDSAVGAIARRRVVALTESVERCRDRFPTGTEFFHLNDMAVATLDVAVDIGSSHTDPTTIGAGQVPREELLKVLGFVSACAQLHQRSIATEDEERIGPAGRTFVVMGKRWMLEPTQPIAAPATHSLQMNLAFAEAYLADGLGEQAGFHHRSHERIYLNDYVWFVMTVAMLGLTAREYECLAGLGLKGSQFPKNLQPQGAEPISVRLFHRHRKFYSVMSHHTWDIADALARGTAV